MKLSKSIEEDIRALPINSKAWHVNNVIQSHLEPIKDVLQLVLNSIECDVCGHTYRSATGTAPNDCCDSCRLREKIKNILLTL